MSRTATLRSPAQQFALAGGVVFLLIGILGFVLAPDAGDKLFGLFQVNLLHNIIHIVIGSLFFAGSSTQTRAKQVNLLVGIVYGLVALLGFVGVLVDDLIDANAADDFLHLATAVLALYFGTVGAGKSY